MGQLCSSNNELGPEESTVPHFKIVVIGPTNSGKTCILNRYLHNRFTSDYTPTERAQIFKCANGINVPDYGLVSITLWDCPGEEDIDLRSTYYRDTDAVIVTADLTKDDSLELACQWKDDFFRMGTKTIHNYLKVQGVWVDSPESQPISDVVPVVLFGTKYDLMWDAENDFILKGLDKFCESRGFKSGIPVTSRWNDGSVLRAFQTVVRMLLDQRRRGNQDESETSFSETTDDEKVKDELPDYGLFLNTNSNKINDLFRRANPCYSRLLEWQYHFTCEIRNMRQYCSQAGISHIEESDKESWDTVLVTLKHSIVRDFKDVKVVDDETNGYMQIEASDMNGAHIPRVYDTEEMEVTEGEKQIEGEMKEPAKSKKKATEAGDLTGCEKDRQLTQKQKIYVVIAHFNVKLAPVLHVVMNDGNLLVDFMKTLDARIVTEVADTDLSVTKLNMEAVEENRVRLTQLEFQIQELLDMVHTFVQKFRTILT